MRPPCLVVPLCAVLLAAGARAAGPPPRDAFGDPLPHGAVARMDSVRLRHGRDVYALAFAPDGKTLATAGASHEVILWNPATGREVRRLTIRSREVRVVRFTPDGKSLAAGCTGGVIHILDPTRGTQRRVVGGDLRRPPVVDLALVPDGKSLVSVHETGSILWDVAAATMRRRYEAPRGTPPPLVQFTPDGKHFRTVGPDLVPRLFVTATGREVRPAATSPRVPPGPTLKPLGLTPDGKIVAVAGGENIVLQELATGRSVPLEGTARRAHALAFAPDGRSVAVASPGRPVCVFDAATGKRRREFPASTPPAALAFSPDGKRLAATSRGSVRLWDVATGRDLHPAEGHDAPVTSLLFLRDGKQVVSMGRDNVLFLWDAATGRPLGRQTGAELRPSTLGLAPDGKAVSGMDCDRVAHFWQPGGGHRKRPLHAARLGAYAMALSPDGKTLALDASDRGPQLLDVEGRKPVRKLAGARLYVAVLAFSPDGRRVAGSCADGLVRVWDTATGKELRALGGGRRRRLCHRLVFAADGRSLLAHDGQSYLYEVASGRPRLQLPLSLGGLNAPLALSPDGRLAARVNPDGTLAVHDAGTGEVVFRRDGRQGIVQALAFSPDGRRLASGGYDGTILVWQMPAVRPARLTALARAALWRDLGADDPARAHRAMLDLAAAPKDALALLREQLKVHHGHDPKHIARLIADLDSDDFETREKASEELAALGKDAEDALRDARKTTKSLEVRRRVNELLGRLPRDGPSGKRLRAVRCVEVLERIGTPAARQVLEGLAKQSLVPELAREVRDSLDRLAARR